ncbi:NADP-dependent phosphogluconate dehydrogenase [Buchnera aphidicola (Mollitrichosiphum nigrofasciatum)]
MLKQQIGVIGMAVMGQNLALNIANCGYTVSIYNRSKNRTEDFLRAHNNKNIFPYFEIKNFINSLQSPRCVLLMVKSGCATDSTINSIIPYLSKNDIVIDGGNTFYKDTIKRNEKLSKYGIFFIGTGISGGEKGALHGPSIMPGGDQLAYNIVKPIFKKISAKVDNEPCVNYIGPNGSGHYVKMVHNGIEYADMQLIAESYFLLKNIIKMSNKELSEIFNFWNQGELQSYLIEITSKILIKKTKSGNYLLDCILDTAEQKGTGSWVSKSALDLCEPLSLITESVFARYISSFKSQRLFAAKVLKGPLNISIIKNKDLFIKNIRKALYLSKIIAYAQGFSQLKNASDRYKWNLNYGKIAKIFRSGCIIRAQFLQKITDTYIKYGNQVNNLLITPYFKSIANKYQHSLREIVAYSISNGYAVPCLSAAISYYDSYRSSFLSSNLIQAQRDYFGAHTYKRIDKKGVFHTHWE